jgi:hypothetical protein
MRTGWILILIFSLGCLPAAAQKNPDTLVIDGVTIIRDNTPAETVRPERKGIFKKLNSQITPKATRTEYGVLDIGVSNFIDRTKYTSANAQQYAPGSNAEWFDIRPFKSKNINIWFLRQTLNLVDYYLNFQYSVGLELNNYFYSQPIRYRAAPSAVPGGPTVFFDQTPGREYRKNKLAADYVTIPLLINVNLTPDRLYPFELGAGISVGYLYSSRNKTITSDEGKKFTKDDFDLRHWKLSYAGELTLGVVTFYGTYAFKGMYKHGLDMTPYTAGLRIRPTSVFTRIESR